MFKNRHIQVKFAKDQDGPLEEVTNNLDPEELARYADEFVKKSTIAIATLMGVAFVFNTLNAVIVNNTDPARKKK